MKWKFFIVSLLSTLSFSVYASTVNLNVGDVITLQPGSTTTVSCGGGNEILCQLPIRNLTTKFNLCNSQQGSIEDCLGEYWPAFKKSYSNCTEEAYSTCVTFCTSSPVALDCLDLCK